MNTSLKFGQKKKRRNPLYVGFLRFSAVHDFFIIQNLCKICQAQNEIFLQDSIPYLAILSIGFSIYDRKSSSFQKQKSIRLK